jgi:SAM-dependent methyltransferase
LHPRYRQTCRVCGSSKLTPVIDLGAQYLQGAFTNSNTLAPPMRKLPTKLVRCDVTSNENGCGLLQLAHTYPPEILYANYWYRSGTNVTMRDHLAGIVSSALDILKVANPTVLDIGCNDGTLLRNFPKNTVRYGVDPSDIAREVEDELTLINTIFPSKQALAGLPNSGIDLITTIAMFYDLEDPINFAQNIRHLLTTDGIWVFEMSYLPLMLLQNSFDTICHEHLEYYSFSVLETIVARADMRVFKAELSDINGGSIRCYACIASNNSYGSSTDREFLHRIRIREFEMELDTDKPYVSFQERISQLKHELNSLLRDIRARGERIHVYGASTKGNVLLQWYGIGRDVVDCAADRNPQKVGSRTLGTEIPIISEAESRAAKPDYYLVLPWHFRKEFLAREEEAIRSGTKMIFPLPNVEVVSAQNYEDTVASAERPSNYLTHLMFGR